MQGMLDNPEVLRSMLHANPQMREMMENNPEIAHILNDPQLLRQSLQHARNPQLMREQMRNTDRAMSNIEAHPVHSAATSRALGRAPPTLLPVLEPMPCLPPSRLMPHPPRAPHAPPSCPS